MSCLGRRNKVLAMTSPREEAEAFTYVEFGPPHPNDVNAIKYHDKITSTVSTAINDPVTTKFGTYEILRPLTPNCSPSFHKYGKNPPSRVLDLGCEVHNVEWDRSNFVKDSLPYAEDSFDLVRMANLSPCIPRQHWEFVFSEVWRILAPGGRLELIDDDLEFPTIAPPPLSVPHLQKSLNRHCVIIGAEWLAAAVGGSDTRLPLGLRTPRLVPQKLEQEDEVLEELYLLEAVGEANGTKQPNEQDNTVIPSDHLHLVWENQYTNLLGLGIDEESNTSLEPLDLPVLN
ncbi:predicted protein [Postia placenta Mad-698-R]|nr:predicted protein [Postia placenta Mad-698-R]